jgi:hypothetical protein
VASDSSMCSGVDSASKNEYHVNPGGKSGRCVRLTTYHLHVPLSRNLGVLTSWNPMGLFRVVMGQLYLYLYLLSFGSFTHRAIFVVDVSGKRIVPIFKGKSVCCFIYL